jgi:Ca2+-binding RTX toxin-like protein
MAIIYGTTGPDTKRGTPGNDEIYGWARGGNATSTSGNDTLSGSFGDDSLAGGTGDDNLNGGPGIDTLTGGVGDDSLYGDSGSSFLSGGDGNDYFSPNAGANHTVSGGAGIDTLSLFLTELTGDISINLTDTPSGTIPIGSSSITFSSIENFDIWSTVGNDTIIGSNGNDTLYAYGYEHFLDGGAGDDYLNDNNASPERQGGNNTLRGGAGNDSFDTYYSDDSTLSGGLGDDYFSVNSSSGNSVSGGDGDDYFGVMDLSDSSLSGGAGNDLINVLYLDGNNTLSGGAGDDRLNVTASEQSNNTLSGGNGNDTLEANGGYNDTLTGGSGNDLFRYSSYSDSFGSNTITDFHKVSGDTDKIVLDKETFTAITSNIGTGFSKSSEFAIIANDAAAATSQALIVYNQGTGNLFYNQNGALDGLGTGRKLGTLTNQPLLAATDFTIGGDV